MRAALCMQRKFGGSVSTRQGNGKHMILISTSTTQCSW